MKTLVRTCVVFLLLVVSIYGQQATQNSKSAAGTVSATGQRPTEILKEPTVLGTGDTWAVISWTTNAGGKDHGKIYAGTNKSQMTAINQMVAGTAQNGGVESYQEQEYPHLVRLNNLKPGTTYYFRADSSSGSDHGVSSKSNIWQFTTSGVAPVKAAVASASSRRPSTNKTSAKAKPRSTPAPASDGSEAASLRKSSS
jgi:hypothetical protein